MVWSDCLWCQASGSLLDRRVCAERPARWVLFSLYFEATALRETAVCIAVGVCGDVPCLGCLSPGVQQLWQDPASHHTRSTSFGTALLITACSLSPLQAHHRPSRCMKIPLPSLPVLNHHQANISVCVSVPKECLIISLFLLSFLPAPFKCKMICTSLWP